MPSLTGKLLDNAFDIEELGLVSIRDLPFDGFFVNEDVTILINVFDIATPVEALAVSGATAIIEEVPHGGTSFPTRVREAQRIRQLIKLRRMLDDEEVLLLME